MWIFSLITVILATVVKISAPCHTVRDHYRCVHTSPLPPLEMIQPSLEIKCIKRFNKGKGNPDISCLISSHSRTKLRCIHQGDELYGLFQHSGYGCRVLLLVIHFIIVKFNSFCRTRMHWGDLCSQKHISHSWCFLLCGEISRRV